MRRSRASRWFEGIIHRKINEEYELEITLEEI
jgi:hypothetical protein